MFKKIAVMENQYGEIIAELKDNGMGSYELKEPVLFAPDEIIKIKIIETETE